MAQHGHQQPTSHLYLHSTMSRDSLLGKLEAYQHQIYQRPRREYHQRAGPQQPQQGAKCAYGIYRLQGRIQSTSGALQLYVKAPRVKKGRSAWNAISNPHICGSIDAYLPISSFIERGITVFDSLLSHHQLWS